jgi:hypothetical protein
MMNSDIVSPTRRSASSTLPQFPAPKANMSVFDYDDERPDLIPQEENHELNDDDLQFEEDEEAGEEHEQKKDEEKQNSTTNSNDEANVVDGIFMMFILTISFNCSICSCAS